MVRVTALVACKWLSGSASASHLADTEKLHENAVQSIADRYGKKYTWELKLQIMGTTGVDSARTVIEALGLPLSVEDYLADLGRIYAEKYPHVDLVPGEYPRTQSSTKRANIVSSSK
ncbi:hypothetical protein V5799_018131 [Amblyomma americanum]|uniref:Secreted protein n=1 Tax=Amblyomma americanum TaxID=6943 RepID=A0AAQ4F046_AMBAM